MNYEKEYKEAKSIVESNAFEIKKLIHKYALSKDVDIEYMLTYESIENMIDYIFGKLNLKETPSQNIMYTYLIGNEIMKELPWILDFWSDQDSVRKDEDLSCNNYPE